MWVKVDERQITLTPAPMSANFKLVYGHSYPLAQTYSGMAEECYARFTVQLPEQFFPTSWVVDRIADSFEEEVAKQGAKMLSVKIYEDATPLIETHYLIVAQATKPQVALARPQFVLSWGVVIAAALVICFLLAIWGIVTSVTDFFYGPPGKPPLGGYLVLAGVAGLLVFGFLFARKRKYI